MIKADQPTCFPGNLIVAVSSKQDGTMLDRQRDFHAQDILEHRRNFCAEAGMSYDDCVYELIRYGDTETYDNLVEVTKNDTICFTADVAADGLFTSVSGVGLFLPVADCVATVVYDPVRRYLAVLHLGRHASYANLSTCTIKHFIEKGSDPSDLIIWMSPSAGPVSYRLDWFDRESDPLWQNFYTRRDDGYYLDLAGYNREQFVRAGALHANIHVSPVDTMTDDNYFSHRGGDMDGRVAVVAMMRD